MLLILLLYKYHDIQVTHHFKDKSKNIIIQRYIDPKCLNLAITHDTVFSQDYANINVPNECKKNIYYYTWFYPTSKIYQI